MKRQGWRVWSQHVGGPIPARNMTRGVHSALFTASNGDEIAPRNPRVRQPPEPIGARVCGGVSMRAGGPPSMAEGASSVGRGHHNMSAAASIRPGAPASDFY
jgi:hypothetical protein